MGLSPLWFSFPFLTWVPPPCRLLDMVDGGGFKMSFHLLSCSDNSSLAWPDSKPVNVATTASSYKYRRWFVVLHTLLVKGCNQNMFSCYLCYMLLLLHWKPFELGETHHKWIAVDIHDCNNAAWINIMEFWDNGTLTFWDLYDILRLDNLPHMYIDTLRVDIWELTVRNWTFWEVAYRCHKISCIL